MARVERRPEGGGRLYVSIRKDDVMAFEQAASELEAATGLSVSQLVVRQMLDAHKRARRRVRRGQTNNGHDTAPAR
jgi:hypothetical protein